MTLAIERERPATAAPPAPKTSPRDVLAMAKKEGVQIVDLRFVDMPGTWQYFSPIDKDLYDGEHRSVKPTPGSLEEVLDALDADRDFLMRGGVFTEDLIEEWLGFKRASAKQVALRPHPYEFYLYSDV